MAQVGAHRGSSDCRHVWPGFRESREEERQLTVVCLQLFLLGSGKDLVDDPHGELGAGSGAPLRVSETETRSD